MHTQARDAGGGGDLHPQVHTVAAVLTDVIFMGSSESIILDSYSLASLWRSFRRTERSSPLHVGDRFVTEGVPRNGICELSRRPQHDFALAVPLVDL